MDEKSRGQLADLIINLRATPFGDEEVIAGLKSGSLTKLSRDKAIQTEIYRSLEEHERAFIRALAVGRGAHRALLTGFSAARIHGMWVAGQCRAPVELGLKKTPPRSQWNPGTVYRRLDLPDDRIVSIGGVRTPRLFRIFAEIARHHGFPNALVAADWLRRQGMDLHSMREEAELLGRFPGIEVVDRAIEHSIHNSDSALEPYARGILIEERLPVQGQALLCDGSYRTDLLIGTTTVVEIDGDEKYFGKHGPTSHVLVDEKKRENRIRNTGKSVLRYGADDLFNHRDRFVREVRADYERHLKSDSAQRP